MRVGLLVLAIGCYAPDTSSSDASTVGPHWKKSISLSADVAAPLAGFPVGIEIVNDPDLMAHAAADGSDVWFTDEAGALLPSEVERANGGHLSAWVRVPELPATSTVVLHYGAADPPRTPAPVFDADSFRGVWHLADGSFRDSAGEADGAESAQPDFMVSLIGRAYQCDGNDWVTLADTPFDFGMASFSVSAWVFTNGGLGEYDRVWYKGGANASYPGYALELGTLSWSAEISDGSDAILIGFSPVPLDGDWHLLTMVVDRLNGLLLTYVDGAEAERVVLGTLGSLDNAMPATISSSSFSFNGLIDEVRVYPRALEPEWIRAEYANLRSAAFVQVGIQEDAR